MRLLTDPQPAIEWFCTGGSVCIGVEGLDERADLDLVRDRGSRPAAAKPSLPARFPVTVAES